MYNFDHHHADATLAKLSTALRQSESTVEELKREIADSEIEATELRKANEELSSQRCKHAILRCSSGLSNI